MAYKEWGDPRNRDVVVCVHGLSRVSDDFDALAAALCDRYRVICPDVVGRGRSDWLSEPMHYQVPQYVSDMVTLLARLDVESVHWVGTSMGGLIAMGLAATPRAAGVGRPIRRLILNDVGPIIEAAALSRIGAYVGAPVSFDSQAEGIAYVRAISASFGPHSDAQWHKIGSDVLREKNGRWVLHYDPAIGVPFKAVWGDGTDGLQRPDLDLWPFYEAIDCPTLAIRGAESDLLSRPVFEQMAERGPRARLVELPGVGHAAMFQQPDQIALVREFLQEKE